jgi:hypothetical protein
MSIRYDAAELRGWREALDRFTREEIPIPQKMRRRLADCVAADFAELDLLDWACRESERIDRAIRHALFAGLEATKPERPAVLP